MSNESVTLTTLGGGAAVELFQEQLDRVLTNIADVNTEAEEKREITLKVVLHPNAQRDTAAVEIIVGAKTAPIKGATTTFFMGKHAGQRIAVEQNPKQLPLLADTPPAAFPALAPAPAKE